MLLRTHSLHCKVVTPAIRTMQLPCPKEALHTRYSPVSLLRSWTCELLPMHSPSTALTLTAYLLSGLPCDPLVLTDLATPYSSCFVIRLPIVLLMLCHAY
jgi:hypothetical protein